MAQTSSDMTRIQIERVEDWNRIRENFTNTTFDTLSERLAKSSSQHVREAVTAHLIQWRDGTFDAAKENLRVNGRNLEDYIEEEETEPFDEVLDRRIWALSTERMTWDKELAERRRATPREVQHLVEDLLSRQRAAEYMPSPVEEHEEPGVDEVRLTREADTASVFEQVSTILDNLRTNAPQILERSKRAQKVVEDIKSLS